MEFLIGGHVAQFRQMLDEIKLELAQIKHMIRVLQEDRGIMAEQ